MTRSSRQIEQSIDTAGDVSKALFDLYYKLKSASSNLGIAVAGVEEAAKTAPEKYKRELQLYSDMLESAGDLVDACEVSVYALRREVEAR
jgi:stress response protein YsnF